MIKKYSPVINTKVYRTYAYCAEDKNGRFVHVDDYAALQQKLERYSMSAGQADQFAAEAKSVRQALGFSEDAQDVAPVDLLEKISGLRAEGVEMFALCMAEEAIKDEGEYHDKSTASNLASSYAEALRSGTHDTADKAG